MIRDTTRRFQDRAEAGRQLAAALRNEYFHNPLVLAIPRGGVVVGAALADALGAELDVVLVRKLRHPHAPECAVGAVGEDGRVVINPEAAGTPGMTPEFLRWERQFQESEIARRRLLYRAVRPPAHVRGRSVILTDDGIATGSTAAAALAAIRSQSPAEIVLAVPVASPDRLAALAGSYDRAACLSSPPDFRAVAGSYVDFGEVTDEEVVKFLRYVYRPEVVHQHQEAVP